MLKRGVFRAYIALFDPEKDVLRKRLVPLGSDHEISHHYSSLDSKIGPKSTLKGPFWHRKGRFKKKSLNHEGHEGHEEKQGWLAFGQEDVRWWSSLHFWRS